MRARAAVGRDVAIPKGATVIDVTGKIITPGLIDAYGRLGVTEIDGEAATVDESSNNLPYSAACVPVTPPNISGSFASLTSSTSLAALALRRSAPVYHYIIRI